MTPPGGSARSLGIAPALAAIVIVGLVPGAAGAATFNVNHTADRGDFNTADPFCDSNPTKAGRQCTLRAGVEQTNAQPGRDRLLLPPRTFEIKPGIGFGQLSVSDDLVVDGTSAAKTVIRLSAPASRIFEVGVAARLDLRDATVRDGVVADTGGGIRSFGTLILRRSRVRSNEAFANSGGGIYATGPTTILTSEIGGPKPADGNRALAGAGIYAVATGDQLVVRGSSVSNNIAETGDPGADVPLGGGIASIGAKLRVAGSEIRGNVARFVDPPTTEHAYGGGVFVTNEGMSLRGSVVVGNRVVGGPSAGAGLNVWTGPLTVVRSSIRGNVASEDASGGGISYGFAATASRVTVRDSTVARNRAGTVGGGISLREASGELENVTLSRNESENPGNPTVRGQDLFVHDATLDASHVTVVPSGSASLTAFTSTSPPATMTLRATVLGRAGVPVCTVSNGSAVTSLGFNVSRGTDCNLTASSDRPGINPRLGGLALNGGPTRTHALRSASPAVNRLAKGACAPPNRDQRGVKRPQGKRCDAGAYERKK